MKATVRPVLLHTLLHGSVTINVVDHTCPGCQMIVPYEGRRDGLFFSQQQALLN